VTQRGRKSAASLELGPLAARRSARISLPPGLSEPACAIFLDLVNSLHPTHFEPADATLLGQYCEAAALAARSAARLQDGDVAALGIWEKSTRTMSGLALRLRIGPQSRGERAKAGRPLTWTERFRLEHGDGEPSPTAPWES
jgi:hypothetical protein